MYNDIKKPSKEIRKTAQKGRNGDDHLAHLQTGEMIVPPVITPELRAELIRQMMSAGVNPDKHIVGGNMSINPETGLPEAGFGKIFKKAASIAIPIAAAYYAPAIGGALGLGTGTLGSAVGGGLASGIGAKLTGGDPLMGALSGAAGGYLQAGGGSELLGGTKVGNALGIGGSPVSSAGTVASGVASGSPVAATGGGSSSIGGYINDLYKGSALEDLYKGSGLESFANKASNYLDVSGQSLPEAADKSIQVGTKTPSEGLFSNKALGLGAINTMYGNIQAQNALEKATNAANESLSPYTGIGSSAASKLSSYLGLDGNNASTADILAASPGYNFMLEQGNQQLDRANAARGGFFSGAALKAAQDYGSGLANQTAQNYYTQLANTAGLGLGAANAYGNNTTALGTAQGASDIQTANMINQLLSGYYAR